MLLGLEGNDFLSFISPKTNCVHPLWVGAGRGVHLQPRESGGWWGGGEVGWNKCYTGDGDCVFPMVHYPFTHGPHPKPREPAPPPAALTRKDGVRLSFSPQRRGVLTELIQMKKFNTIDGLPPSK